MDTRYLILLGLLVIQTIAQIDEDDEEDRGPAPGNCVYRLDIPASSLRGSCMTEKFQRDMNDMKAEYARISQENVELRTSLEEVVKDYEEMVDTVRTLKKDTESWRQVVQWPSYEELFKPEDVNAKPVSTKKFVDCYQAHRRGETKQGIYQLAPEGIENPFYGYCLEDGWTVIFRRFDGSVDFNRNWIDFSAGFGNVTGEFFIGLERLHVMTNSRAYELRIESLGYNNKIYNSSYQSFKVGDEESDYSLFVSNETSGNLRGVFVDVNGNPFTTKDRDNDEWYSSNCAARYKGGWWLPNCGSDPSRPICAHVSCMSLGGKPLKKIVMSVRPVVGPSGPVKVRQIKPKPKRKPKVKKQKRKRPGKAKGKRKVKVGRRPMRKQNTP